MQDWLKELADTHLALLMPLALEEDVGAGDLTSLACVPADARTQGRMIAKADLVVAGIELIPQAYNFVREMPPDAAQAPFPDFYWSVFGNDRPAGHVEFEIHRPSGSRVAKSEVIASVSGPTRLLLERERVALNFLQRLSGIATLTRKFVDAVEGTGVKILDTRKTTPGWRKLEKMAVAAGGGTNHRMGLWDAVLIKENHVAAAGGIRQAVEAARRVRPDVEVEVRNLDELRQALETRANWVLLDNMSPGQVREAVAVARRAEQPPKLEVSGGITLDNVRDYALAGPDFISVGALTHSAPAADISFLL